MKKLTLFAIITILSISFSNAQKIEAKKVFGGYEFLENGKKLSTK